MNTLSNLVQLLMCVDFLRCKVFSSNATNQDLVLFASLALLKEVVKRKDR